MKFRILVVSTLFFTSCATHHKLEKTLPGAVTKSCKLNPITNDTIVIRGYYNVSMEYCAFHTMEKDSCYNEFCMNLEMDSCSNFHEYTKYFHELGSMNLYMDITLKGVLQKNGVYGHLGSNNAEFQVLEILQFENYVCYDFQKKTGKEWKKTIIQKDTLLNSTKIVETE